MHWTLSYHCDPLAVPLADRHYSRKTVGSPQFTPPGRKAVFLTDDQKALWVTSWPYPELVAHRWPNAWICTLFRNEGPVLSSKLIREAVAATRHCLGEPPELGMVTWIHAKKVRRKRDPGRCFRRAGFLADGMTKNGLVALVMPRDAMPAAEAPQPQLSTMFLMDRGRSVGV